MSEKVFVAHLETVNGVGWTSVHRSQPSAELRLLAVAESWGYPGVLDVFGFADFNEQPAIRSWSVSYLPVEV